MSQTDVVANIDRFTIKNELQGCYVFSREQLVSLFTLIERGLGKKPEVTLELDNNRAIKSDDIGQILNDPFIESNVIASMRYSIYSLGNVNTISIYLRDTWSAPISYEIAGERNFCLSTEQSILSIIKSAKKWYGILNMHNHNSLLGLLEVMCLAFIVSVIVYVPFYKQDPKAYPWAIPIPFTFVVFSAPYAIGKLLPKMVFNLGRGRVLHERMLRPVKWLTSAVFLGLLGNYFREQISGFIGSLF
ncbi:hypothetical protein [Mesorhizobium sp.]|uniref:hypothetical protein n=1 Tax=Mesorhizobium sp. TaxID=1871066 RepID=UPI000FE6BD33|nr:hypothetical protein [Mesorhizobium sp.]RWF62556.1 MAG: hypothetical protein EOS47_23035 [Mesorhizobium sp.]TIT42134.1 MAG: hypothetical protein E5W76_11605 [Mesorhizobium sp.]